MKSKRLLLMLLIALIAPWAANAQTLGDYTFSTGNDATKWKTVTSTTTYLVSGGDSQASTLLNIGFTFPFGEDTYTQFSVNTDGNLRLGSTATGTSQYNTPFGLNYGTNNANYNNPKINAFGCDGYATANNYVKYQTFDNNLLVVEFCMNTYNQRSNTALLFKWQIQLHANGDIEIVFPGTSELPTTNPTVNHQCGLCVNSSDGWVIKLSDNTAEHFTDGSTTTNVSGTWFDANRYYTFTRPVLTCFRPQNLAATLTPGDGSIATLTWERHSQGTEDAWVLEYGTASDFTGATSVNVSGTPSKDLTGLTPETTYYARVKPDCDTDGSLWSATCTFTPSDAYSITLNDQNTITNSYIPIYGNYVDWGNRNQFIIPATALADLQWASIEKLTFYATQSSAAFTNDVFSVYMTEVPSATFASNAFVDWSSLSTVYSGSVSIANNKMEIEFDTPYTYSGGNLLIGFQQTAYNTTVTCTWVGTTQTENTALYQYANSSHEWSGTVTAQKFLPKVTIEYTPGEAPSCLPATNLAANDVTAHTASLSWTANNGESTWKLYWKKSTDANFTEVSAGVTNPYPLSGLDGETQYTFYVVADCGDGGESDPSLEYSFTTLVACPIPTTLTVVENTVTTNSVTLSWTENGTATAWQICLNGDEDNLVDVDESELVEGNYTLQGLTHSTNYTVKVRANCGGIDGTSEWSNQVSFATECEATDLADVDYSENFDSYTAATGFLPLCWNRINEGTSYTNYPYIYGYNAHSTSNCLYFYTYGTSGSDQYAILPAMENMEGKQITLWAKGYNVGNTFKIGMMTDPAVPSTFVEIAEQELTTTWDEYSFILGRGNYVAFLMEVPTTSVTKGVYIDDITIADVPACVKPSDLTFVSATTTSATIGWTIGGNENAWQIAYSTDPAFDPDEVTPVDVTSNPGTINGLTGSTTYYAYVRANCGNNGYSDWSNAYCMFTTECEAITNLPWSENFDAYTGSTSTTAPAGYPNDQLPTCWQFLNRSENSSAYPQVFISSNSGYPVSGKCLFFKSSSTTPLYAILPEFSEDIANLQLTFTYRNEGESTSNGQLIVGYMTDPTDATTFTEKHTCERTTTLTEQEVLFTNAPAGSYIAFKYQGGTTNNYYLSIDNVSVNYPPTCLKPTDLVFVSATTTSATLGWTAGGTETAWQIAYSTDPAFDPDEVTHANVTSNPGIISGLTAATTYYAYVRANCGNDDYSDWSSTYCMFATECDVVTVDAAHPFTEGFEGTTFAPNCWENIASGTHEWSRTTTSSYIHTGSGAAYSGYYGDIYLVMPDLQISNEADAAQLTFWSFNTYTSDYDKNSVVLLDGDDEIELWSPTSVSQSWVPTTIDLTQYIGQTISLAFKYEGSNAHGWYIDDVMVAVPFTKHIAAHYVNNEGVNCGWYLIASPLDGETNPTDVTNLISATAADYDLYRFNQDAAPTEWENYKNPQHQEGFKLVNGKGYLYANANTVDLVFTGMPFTGTTKTVELDYVENKDFTGWNLVGNPFTVDAYIHKPYYTLNSSASTYYEATVEEPIKPMEGIFVIATEDGETLTFDTAAPAKSPTLNLNLTQGRGMVDRAIVRFGQGGTLPKLQFREGSTKVYIPQEGKDYAVVNADNAGELPVNFKAENNGTFTMSFSNTEVEFSYLHLIDNMTGNDIDLLQTPSYTFNARTTDYESRFKLVFATGSNGSDDSFAFFSDGNFIINNDGEATLQVIDVNGRILSSESINGSVSKTINAASGVYMLRLINGNDVKVQKVVVK